MSRPIIWTPEMDEALVHMSSGAGQVPFDIMAERLGVCVSAMLNRQKQLGIFRYRGRGKKPLDWTEPMIATVRDLWPDPSITINDISSRLKISTTAVAKKAAEIGFSRKATYDRSPDEYDREILRYIARHPGCGSSEIMAGTRLDRSVVYAALRRLRTSNRCRRRDKPTYFANIVSNEAADSAAADRLQQAA